MAEQRRKRCSFAAEYRAEAAGRVIESGRPVAHVAREPGLGVQLLGKLGALHRRQWSQGRHLSDPARWRSGGSGW